MISRESGESDVATTEKPIQPYTVMASAYIDTDSEIRVLVFITHTRDMDPIQTVGSWKVNDPALPEIFKAAVYALNVVNE